MQTHGLDIFGQEVYVGDTVAAIVPYYSCLTLCKVKKVTPKGFTVEYKDSNGKARTTNRSAGDVVKGETTNEL